MSRIMQCILPMPRLSSSRQMGLVIRKIPLSRSYSLNLLCQSQSGHHLLPHSLGVPSATRCFANSPPLYKKKEKTKRSTATEVDVRLSKTEPLSDDPLDLSELRHGIEAAVLRLTDDISKLSVGGRFNTEAIESLRVHVSKGSKDTVKLGELAQVVPKGGRMVTVLVAEEDHMKPITSAIISSNLSLNPQQDSHNALQLNIPIPPPTKESRDQTVHVAKLAMEKAANAIRDARGAVHKRLQEAQKKKTATPDQVRKAREQMEKIAEKGQKEVRDLFETSKKALERG